MSAIEICPTCVGVGVVYDSELEEGGGNNGADYERTFTIKCETCAGSGRVTSRIVYEPYKHEGGARKWK